MFRLRRNRIDSDKGFAIEFDRNDLIYIRDGETVRINHEMLPQPKSIAIWLNSIATLNAVSEERTADIISDVVVAFRSVGYDVVVV